MPFAVAPSNNDVQTILRSFLLGILPTGVEVIEGQPNRVPEPAVPDFVVMTCIRRPRLTTSIDNYLDTLFQGSIAGTVMTATEVSYGKIAVGAQVFGIGIASNTFVTGDLGGGGGAGDYAVGVAQDIGPIVLAAGVVNVMQETEIRYQLDVHGPASADNAQIITTLFRDNYGVDAFLASGMPVTPLYTEDPIQIPFRNENQQIETRWVVEAAIQADQTVLLIPQQFFDKVTIRLIEADTPATGSSNASAIGNFTIGVSPIGGPAPSAIGEFTIGLSPIEAP